MTLWHQQWSGQKLAPQWPTRLQEWLKIGWLAPRGGGGHKHPFLNPPPPAKVTGLYDHRYTALG